MSICFQEQAKDTYGSANSVVPLQLTLYLLMSSAISLDPDLDRQNARHFLENLIVKEKYYKQQQMTKIMKNLSMQRVKHVLYIRHA